MGKSRTKSIKINGERFTVKNMKEVAGFFQMFAQASGGVKNLTIRNETTGKLLGDSTTYRDIHDGDEITIVADDGGGRI